VGSPCPACGVPGPSDAASCPQCGLDLAGPDAGELRRLNARLAEIDHERGDVWERRRVVAERATRAWAPPERRQASPTQPPTRIEWSIDRVRTILLWVGAALLAASALAFTTVAWAHLGDGGRALLLAGVTAVCIVAALALRTRLPATAQTACALAIALCVIDWQALRPARRSRPGAIARAA
jgi:hypothetical protein